MSEAERKRRSEYKRKRKKLLSIQVAVMIVVAVLVAAFAFTYYQLNKTYYINYTEGSDIDYKVYLKENDFYEEDWLPMDQAYVASLIDKIAVDLKYNLNMQTENINYEYSYSVGAVLKIVDKKSGEVLFSPEYVIKENTAHNQNSSNRLTINEKFDVDYGYYNDLATRFIDVYGLNDVSSTLVLAMKVKVIGDSESFEESSNNNYDMSLNIPLTAKTVNVTVSSTVPSAESKVLACKNAVNQNLFKNLAVGLSIFELALLLFFVAFVYLTRNEDINYTIRVQKILSAYRSYIQRINHAFDTTDYQLLEVSTFNEMLEIRDIIQSPILMNENEDKTCTKFVIPTNTKLLYVFELKVEDYDDIYKEDKAEAPVIETVNEEPKAEVIEEPVAEVSEEAIEEPAAEVTEEATEEPAVEVIEKVSDEPIAATIEEVSDEPIAEAIEEVSDEPIAEAIEEVSDEPKLEIIASAEEVTGVQTTAESAVESINDDDGIIIDGKVVHIRYRSSFSSRLIQAEYPIQQYYTEIKNRIMSYKGVKARTSWACETFNKGRVQLVKLNVKGKTIHLSLALDPKEYIDTKYRLTDMSSDKKAERLPALLKVKSERGVKYALELIDDVMAKQQIKKGTTPKDVYYMPYETNRMLAKRGLVKIILPKGVTLVDGFDVIEADVSHHISNSIPHGSVITDAETIAAIAKEENLEITVEEVKEVMQEPAPELESIDFVDEVDEVYDESEEKPGVEVIGVVWPEHAKKNKVYRYDPHGEEVEDGDIVLVPSRDVHKNKDIVRKAAVAHGNHKVDPDTLRHPLKKIIAVVKRKAQEVLLGESKKPPKSK